MLAFSQAIAEFEKEGGVKGRGARYSIHFIVSTTGGSLV